MLENRAPAPGGAAGDALDAHAAWHAVTPPAAVAWYAFLDEDWALLEEQQRAPAAAKRA